MLTVTGVSKSYGDHELFSRVSFTVGMSDRIAVIGRNGTGKTTLFGIIMGNIIPDSGSVSLRRDTAVAIFAKTFNHRRSGTCRNMSLVPPM